MKRTARNRKGKLYFMYTRLKDAVEIEIGRGKSLATFIIYDSGELEVVSIKARD